jgi:ECF transporter S component (folate family)
MLNKTSIMTQLAMLLAISLVLSMLGVMLPIAGINGMKVTFSFLPIMLAGFIYGPAAGALVGALTDILGYIVKFHAFGPYFPGFTLTTALSGALPVLICKMLGCDDARKNIFKLAVAIAVTAFVVTVTDTYWLQILYGQAFWVTLPARVVKGIVFIPIQVISLNIVLRLYRRLAASH